jgi:hyperosmotically inducible periplasmic protein
MKTKFAGKYLLAGALLLPVAGFAADLEKTHKVDQYLSESAITAKVKAEMAVDKPSSLIDFSVRTDKQGVVVLNGVARTQADKDRAEKITRNIDGVKTVHNNIQLKSE